MTPNGREFIARTRAFLDDAQDYHLRSLGMSRSPTGRIDVSCFFSIAPYLMPPVIRALAKSNPGISINLSEGDLNEVIHLVKNGNIEAALTYDACSDKDVFFETLFEAAPYALLSATDPLARRNTVSLNDLVDRPLALLDLPVTDVHMQSFFAIHGLRPTIGFRTKRAEMIRSLAGGGMAYSIFLFHPANQESYDGSPLAYVPIKEPLPKTKIVLAIARQFVQTRTLMAFMEECRTTFRDNNAAGPFLLRRSTG